MGIVEQTAGKSTELYDDASVCEVIRSELTKPSLSSWINGQVIVSCLRNYRDWKAHVQTNSPVTFEAFLHCVNVFLFCLFSGCSQLLLLQIHHQSRKVDCCWTRLQTISSCFASEEARGCQKKLRLCKKKSNMMFTPVRFAKSFGH